MDEREKLTLDFLRAVTLQLVAFATGTLALTVSFVKDFSAGATWFGKCSAILSWIFFALSILGGLWTLYAITGSLEPRGTKGTDHLNLEFPVSIHASNIRFPSTLQIVFFLGGVSMTVLLGVLSILEKK